MHTQAKFVYSCILVHTSKPGCKQNWPLLGEKYFYWNHCKTYENVILVQKIKEMAEMSNISMNDNIFITAPDVSKLKHNPVGNNTRVD